MIPEAEKGISVIICCYNSALRLPETLQHLSLQITPPELKWEVIVVDNASTDNTAELAEKTWQELSNNNPLTVVKEIKPGLSAAREKGVEIAKYEYLIFCDDDNWLDERYLQESYKILSENKKVGATGGQGIAISDVEFPEWFEQYKHSFAIGKQAERSSDVSERMYLWGAGLAFKKRLFTRAFFNLPSLLTDRKGETLSSGGDSEICLRLLLMGYTLYYSEKLKYKHFIPSQRLTIDYREKLYQGFEQAKEVLQKYMKLVRIVKQSKFSRILKSLTVIILSKIGLIKRERSTEMLTIYYLTGFKLDIVTEIDLQIRALYVDLKKEAQAVK